MIELLCFKKIIIRMKKKWNIIIEMDFNKNNLRILNIILFFGKYYF